MKKSPAFILLFCFCGTILCGQTKSGNLFIDTTGNIEYNGKIENIGFSDENGLSAADSMIRIDTISGAAFEKFKKKYSPKIDRDSTRAAWTDTSFTVKFKNISTAFPANRICECTSFSYIGFLKPLNLFLINSVDMKNELAYMLMIDSNTGKSYESFTPYDEGTAAVCISSGNTYLLTYANTTYEHNQCVLDLLRINPQNGYYRLQDVMQININNLNINDLVWINENSFALSVREEVLSEDLSKVLARKYCLKIIIQK